MDDLLDLVEAAGASPAEQPASSHDELLQLIEAGEDPGTAPPIALPVEAPSSSGCSALEDLVEVATVEPATKKWRKSSWELCAFARSQRNAQLVEKKVISQQELNTDILQVVAKLMYRVPGVQALLYKINKKKVDYNDSTLRASALSHVAFLPSIKGNFASRQAQTIAVSTVAKCALAQQQAWLEQVFRPSIEAGGPPAGSDDVSQLVKVFTWQWDETSQRVRAMLPNRLPGERVPHIKVATQVMMQSGLLSTFDFDRGCSALVSAQEWLCRGHMLAEQTADFILEGMACTMPFFFDDVDELLPLCPEGSTFIVSLCCDRAAANFRACAWLWRQMNSPVLRRSLLPHIEPCALHGIHLVKCRAIGAKKLLTTMSSLGCLMRQWRFSNKLRDEILSLVEQKLCVKREPRPDGCSARVDLLVDLLLNKGGHLASDEWLYKTNKDGTKVKGQLLLDIEAMAAAVDFGSMQTDEIVHYCYVQEGDEKHALGVAPGDPCCESREEAVEKVALPLIQWFCHRSWEQSAENRWTKSVSLLRKVLTGILAQRVLPECLKAMQTSWGVDESIAAALVRMIKADANDFSSRNKMRLLRVCRNLCPLEAAADVAIVLQCLLMVDPILYELLGGSPGDKERMTLAMLCDWKRNPISEAQHAIVDMIEMWGEPDCCWLMVEAVGMGFDDTRSALKAKAELLGLAAGLVDHFELRMGAPPYSLIRLLSPDASPAELHRCVDSFLRCPDHCLTEFARRLRQQHPTELAMLGAGRRIVEAWAKGCFVDIGLTERSHGLMRQELCSEQRARSFARSSNRSVCQEVKSLHIRRGGTDPLKGAAAGVPPAARDAASSESKDKKLRLGGRALPPVLFFRNHHYRQHKIAHPDQTMTPDDMEKLSERCHAEWAAMTEVERNAWRTQSKAKKLADFVDSHAESQSQLLPLDDHRTFHPWVGCGCRARPIPIEAIAEELSSSVKGDRKSFAYDDPSLSVKDAPKRASSLPPGSEVQHGMWGCSASKLVCRVVMPRSLAAALDALVHRMNSWVAALGADVVKQSASLVCFRGVHPSSGLRKDVIALLIFSRRQPTMHYYAMCNIKGVTPLAPSPETMPDDPPFVASLRVVKSRMSDCWSSFDIMTSEEVAHELVKTHMTWSIVPLQWRLQDGGSPLGDHVVLRYEGPFEPKAKLPRDKVVEVDDYFDQLSADGDPIAAGIRTLLGASPATGVPPGCSRSALLVDAASAASLLDEAAVEAELLEDLDDDEFEDLHEELFGPPIDLDDGGVAPIVSVESLAETVPEGPNGEVLVDDDDTNRGGGDPPLPGPDPPLVEAMSIDDAITHCHISDSGYVSCDVPPWDAVTTLGRITTWPKQKPEAERSISCRCYIHTQCFSAAKRTKHCSRDILLRWLLSGQIPAPDSSRDRKRDWGDMHKRDFARSYAETEAVPSQPL